ncbi:FAD-dependent monooxygenase [Achromobacter sp. SD115]|uniref:FAD-dependent monooxygenase n=1 Tax=Achromobacter sp. SD115 TaxID=2782011 RepID=UPI001A965C3E|nr:FAD-dependent monooxygenase [Achromobacter sp. SD115]MBO1017181.1 FAD-dependent monooxygenase [Achromobacter sp. SD115]
MPLERIGPFEYRRFPPSLPPLAPPGEEARHHRVLIAGGGPVGLAAALGLARLGIDSVVIEADDSVCEGSRAACISRRSLEILERLGVAPAFMEKGLAWTRGRSYYGTEEVLVFDMPSSQGDKYPPMINLQQYYIEQFLLDAIDEINRRFPGRVDIRWASKVTECRPDAAGVTLRIENPLGSYDTRADWLLACDGGQSFVRASLGLELKGTGYQGRYAIVDIELASEHPAERRAWFDPPWARGTTILMHRQPDNIWRVDYQLKAGADAAQALQPDPVRAFVQTHLDAIGEGHLPWAPVWTSVYRAGAMTLDAYRHGRILFAGNAAHAMPIFGVRGLNSGFDDADNLVWKLAAVLEGKGTEALLDSYCSERRQAFHINAENAMRSTEFMSPPHRGFDLMREASLSLAGRHPGIARLVNPRQTQALAYAHSPLSTEDEGGGAWAPGAPLVDRQTADGQYLTDLLTPGGFTLLAFAAWPEQDALEAMTASAAWQFLPCRCVAVAAPDAMRPGSESGMAYLLRPDGHVCGRWRSPSLDTVLSAIQRACGVQGAIQ